MILTAIYVLSVVLCVIRVFAFGVFTVRDGNKTGGVMLFCLCALVVVFSLVGTLRT